MTLSYNNNDDGIHLECECGADIKLDFWPAVKAAVEAEAKHWLECPLNKTEGKQKIGD
jgi:hypothetical protein